MPYIGKTTDGLGIRERFTYLASASDTSVSGADTNGKTLTFEDPEYVDVFLNGIRLKKGTDYNTSTANTIAGMAALAANDEIEVIVTDVFTLADMVSANTGGDFRGNIAVQKDSGVISFGADKEITVTHSADTGLVFKNTNTGDDKPFTLTLQTGETDIAINDKLGVINFQAPDEGTGTDAILVAAGIEAVSEGDFSSSSNATKLSFKTAASAAAAETMSLSSAGNLTVSGTITGGGLLTTGGSIVIPDDGNIGSASDTNAIAISSAGVVTISTNTDSTSSTSGALIAHSAGFADDVFIGDDLEVGGGVIALKNTGTQSELRLYCESSNAHYAALKAPAHSDFSGNTALTLPAVTDTLVGIAATQTLTNKTLTTPVIAEITSGSTITLNATTDIVLDAGGDEVIFKDGSTNVGHVSMDSDNLTIKSLVSDKDMIFQGNDGGSAITALTLDMSAAGAATFNGAITGGGLLTTGGNIVIPDAGNIGSASDTDAIAIASNGVVTFSQAVSGTSADFDGGVTIDNITIDGTEIDLSSGDLTLDVAGNIKLDTDGGDVRLLDGGTQFGVMQNNSSDFVIQSSVSGKDLIFKGNDGGGSAVTALTLDMSDTGSAVFGGTIKGASGTSLKLESPTGGAIIFYSGGANERMRIVSGGNVLVGTTNQSPAEGTSVGVRLGSNGTSQFSSSGDAGLSSNRTSDNGNAVTLRRDGTLVGSISVTGSSTAFNTSSDYRLKENVNYEFDATSRIKQLKPCRFNFIADKDTTVDGFIAHEVSDIIPEAVIGKKDAMTKEVLYVDGDEIPDGKKVGDVKEAPKIDAQGIDQAKLVPLLTKALQEQQTTIEALTARITALEDA